MMDLQTTLLKTALHSPSLTEILDSWNIPTPKAVRHMQPTLRPGQILRRNNELWRVLYVNECRARILPIDRDDRQETNERYGRDIAPTSMVETVTDVERARDEIELAKAEAEIKAAKREIKAQATLQQELAEAEAELAAMKQELAKSGEVAKTGEVATPRGATWQMAAGDHGFCAAGSLKAEVLAFLKAHPGAPTKAVQAGISKASAGAVAACLDRFWKAGVVVKKS
jgi:hypothetical protein